MVYSPTEHSIIFEHFYQHLSSYDDFLSFIKPLTLVKTVVVLNTKVLFMLDKFYLEIRNNMSILSLRYSTKDQFNAY
jgi:hypothetical protein